MSLLGAALALPAQAARPVDAKPGTRFSDCTELCPSMVVVGPGRFAMGGAGGEEGRPEWPVHEVTISYAFAVGEREVSNAEYGHFIAETGYVPTRGCRSFDRQTNSVAARPEADFRNPGDGAGGGAPNIPVVCVSWKDAKAYTAWLSRKTGHSYRLLTEAEWEYAARAGSADDYPWGKDATDGCVVANTLDKSGERAGILAVFREASSAGQTIIAECDDGYAGAAPVGSFRPNAFGLYDMVGNVWEWVEDCYAAPYPANVPTDGSAYQVAGDCPRRSVRGGSWITVPFRNRPAWRGRDPETLVSWIFGFRVARDLAPRRGTKG